MPHLINGNLFYDIKETDGLIPEEAVGVASYAQLVSDDFPSAPTLGDSLYVAIVNASFSNVLPSGTSVGPSTIVRCVKGGNLICIGLLVGKDITQQLYRVIVLSVITLTDSDGDNGSSNLSNYHSGGTWYSLDDTTTGITH
jgi:hypothetical protein